MADEEKKERSILEAILEKAPRQQLIQTAKELFAGEAERDEQIKKLQAELAEAHAALFHQWNGAQTELCLMKDQLANEQAKNAALEEKNKALREAAIFDPLTGFLTRKGCQIQYATMVNEVVRRNKTLSSEGKGERAYLAVLFADIDHFKLVNDTYGHDGGDIALASVANTIRITGRDGDLFCRHGGEELLVFAVVEAMDKQQAHHAAAAFGERMRENVEQQGFVLNDEIKPISLSIGVDVDKPDKEVTVPRLRDIKSDKDLSYTKGTKIADKNVYRAKASGRNAVVYLGGRDEKPVIFGREKTATIKNNEEAGPSLVSRVRNLCRRFLTLDGN